MLTHDISFPVRCVYVRMFTSAPDGYTEKYTGTQCSVRLRHDEV